MALLFLPPTAALLNYCWVCKLGAPPIMKEHLMAPGAEIGVVKQSVNNSTTCPKQSVNNSVHRSVYQPPFSALVSVSATIQCIGQCISHHSVHQSVHNSMHASVSALASISVRYYTVQFTFNKHVSECFCQLDRWSQKPVPLSSLTGRGSPSRLRCALHMPTLGTPALRSPELSEVLRVRHKLTPVATSI